MGWGKDIPACLFKVGESECAGCVEKTAPGGGFSGDWVLVLALVAFAGFRIPILPFRFSIRNAVPEGITCSFS